jgi:hypothetical protein
MPGGKLNRTNHQSGTTTILRRHVQQERRQVADCGAAALRGGSEAVFRLDAGNYLRLIETNCSEAPAKDP